MFLLIEKLKLHIGTNPLADIYKYVSFLLCPQNFMYCCSQNLSYLCSSIDFLHFPSSDLDSGDVIKLVYMCPQGVYVWWAGKVDNYKYKLAQAI